MNPKIQRNFELFSPCDLIAHITQHALRLEMMGD
jgi:hypothetical protein